MPPIKNKYWDTCCLNVVRSQTGNRSWNCKFCNKHMHGSATRMIAHLIGKPSHGVTKCTNVPKEMLIDLTTLYGNCGSQAIGEEEDIVAEIDSFNMPEQGIDTSLQ
mgnify:FL=1